MSRLSKLVREYVKCPQLDGGIEYGEWGALRLDQRKGIAKLCEEVDIFEDAADKFGKENYILKQQLTEKDKEIEALKLELKEKESLCYVYSKLAEVKSIDEIFKKNDEKNLRHQICEKIREWCEQNEFEVENADQSSDCVIYTYKQLFKKLDQIEKGE